MLPLLETPTISIAYDLDNHWLYADWGAEQSLETVQWGALEMLRCLREQRARKVLNDNRRVATIWADAAEWGGRIWFPQMAEAGLEYFAWVQSPNLYSRRSTDLTVSYAERPIIATFDSIDTARNWLRNV